MADVAVAGTFVCAVLEHMGYVTQARFLVQFQSFFRDAGALIYLLAGTGAVVSVVIFGSYRAVQLLLVGPAFFWFLVGPTVKTDGVLWKLGGGSYLGELRSQGRGASEDFRNKVLTKVKEGANTSNIEVAVGFWLFAKPINDFINEFVDRMLDKETTEDLTANHKIAGLELIASALPYEQNHIQRTESFAAECGDMVSAAVAAAQLMAQQRQTGPTGAIAFSAETQRQIDFQITALKHFAATTYISTINTGFGDLIRQQSGDSGTSGLARRLLPMHQGGRNITCGDAWGLVAEETWHTAGRESPRVIRAASGVWEYQQALNYTCQELSRTMNGTATCNIRPGIALFMLYNHLTSMDTYGRVLARHWNQRDGNNPTQSTVISGPMYEGFTPVIRPDGRMSVQRRQTPGGTSLEVELTRPPGPNGPHNERPTRMWAPMSVITGLHGMDHAMWVSTRQYEVTKLRQEIYTYSMQLPYYQGVCLYFIAVIYPFMAIIVLLPGKASNFINVPFAWLWVKSWDIGFATVIIVDKMMYNLLPSWNVHSDLQNGPWVEPEKLARVLAQGFNYDPMGSLHIYYAVMAMLTLSIPALTGAVTMRARRGVLASFTDAPAQAAKDRAEIAGNVYSFENQNRRNAMMMNVTGFARMSAIGGQGNVEGGLRKTSGTATAGISGFAEFVGSTNALESIKLNPAEIARLPTAAIKGYEKFLGDYTGVVSKEANFEGALRAAFDPMIGRSGMIAMYQEAYASAMDGAGGFELSNHQQNALDEFVDLYTHKTKVQNQAMGKLQSISKTQTMDAALKHPVTAAALIAVAGTGKFNIETATEEQLSGLLKGLDATKMKAMLGAQAYTDEEFLARVFNVDRFTADQATKDALRASPLSGVFSPFLDKAPTPGGPSNLVELYLSTAGPDRFLGSLPGEGGPVKNDVVFPYADRTLKTFASAGEGWNDSMQTYFGGLMTKRQDELGYRLDADREFQSNFAGGKATYDHTTMGLRQDYIAQLGGGEGVARLWNSFNPGNQITPVQAGALTIPQLAQLSITVQTDLNKKMFDSFEGGIGKPGKWDAKDATTWMAEVRYYSLPTEAIAGDKNTPALMYLAENNPLLAMQLMNEWHLRVTGFRDANLSTGYTHIPGDWANTPSKLFK